MHAEPLAADEQPSERALAAALRVPGVIEVHNATVLMRPGGRAITLHARVAAGPAAGGRRRASRSGCATRSAARPGATDVYVHLEPHAPGVAAAFDVTGRRADLCERVAKRRPARRRRARRGARVRPRWPLRRGAARARGARAVRRRRPCAGREASRSRCARRSTSWRRSWWRSTRDASSGRPRPSCWHAPTTGSSRRGPTASCARAGRARPTPCSCSARRSA